MRLRPFRLAVKVRSAESAKAWRTKAQHIETLGYDTLLMPDHLTDELAPVPALMAAADATTRLRLSAMVLANDYRHPVMLAKEAATLDLLSDGRFDLALGAGWYPPDYAMLGRALDPGRDRVSRFQEAILLIKRLWLEDTVDHAGRWYQIRAARVSPKPVQRPHPPIVIGASRPAMLTFASRVADVVSFTAPMIGEPPVKDVRRGSPSALLHVSRLIRDAAGPRIGQVDIHAPVDILLTDEPLRHYERVARDFDIPLSAALESPFHAYGSTASITERLIQARARHGFNYFTIREERMAELAGVVEGLRAAGV